jgi:thioredoxin-related protein
MAMLSIVDSGRVLAVVLSLALLPGGPASAQTGAPRDSGGQVEVVHPPWFKESLLDLRADLDDALAAGKDGVLLYFGTRTCSYCHALMETTFAEEDIVARLNARYDVIGLEVLSDDQLLDFQGRSHWTKDFAVQERARFTPTLAFYGEGGALRLRLVGYVPPERFRAVLDYLDEGRDGRQSLRDYLAEREAADRAAEGAIVRDPELFALPPHDLDRRRPADRPLLVVFERPDCAACIRLHRTVLVEPAVREMVGRFHAVQLDATDAATPIVLPDGTTSTPAAWADRLELLHAPALLFFDESGEEVVRADSELLIDAGGAAVEQATPRVTANVVARLRYVLEKGYVEQPQFQQWRNRADSGSSQ